MMKQPDAPSARLRPCLVWFVALALALAACKTTEEKPETLTVPRLMIETRSMDYGGTGGTYVTLPVSGTSIPIRGEPLATEFDIDNVEMVEVDLGLALLIQLDDLASRRLYRATVSNNGSRIVLMVDGEAVGARRIDGAIMDGNLFTFVEETIAYLKTQEED